MNSAAASLELRVNASQVDRAGVSLDRFTGQARRAETATGGFMKRMGGMKTVVAATAAFLTASAAARGLGAVIRETRNFQVLQSSLKTATGSLEDATAAYKELQKFAQTTPNSLNDATTAFIKLTNYGLTPGTRQMKSYGDTAAAMGRSLLEMVEAVAAASSGEMERLKGFGIKARQDGDIIRFAFRGVTTEVRNNAEEIEKYLTELGENNFAGAMTERMNTLDGAFSNLGDSWSMFLIAVGQSSGVASMFEGALRGVITVIDELTAQLDSGQFEASMASWTIAFEGFTEAWELGFADLTKTSQEAYDGLFTDSKGVWDDIIAYLQGIGPMFTAFVEECSIRLWALVTAVTDIGRAMYQQMSADMTALIELGRASGQAIADAFKTGRVGLAAEGLKMNANFALQKNIKATEAIENESANRRMARESTLQAELASIYEKAGDRLQRQEDARRDSRTKRAAYDAERAADTGEDGLARFRVAGDGSGTPTGKTGGGKGKKGGSGISPLQELMRELQTEEQAIAESYARRLQLIQDNTAAGSAARAQASLRALDLNYEDEMRQIDQDKRELDTMMAAFEREEALIRDSYERRKEIILAATQVTEDEKLRMLTEAQKRYANEMKRHNREQNQVYLDAASDFFSNLSQISGIESKKMFKIAQGAAIAQATIKMYEGAVNAYATGSAINPYLGPIMAAAALAAGAGNIASIKGQSYAGAYEHGGMIPAGKYGVVGESGPEVVRGPAVVTSARNTQDRYGRNGSDSTALAPIINIHNNAPVTVEAQTSPDGSQIDFYVTTMKKAIAKDIMSGNGDVARALEGTYPLQRGRVG